MALSPELFKRLSRLNRQRIPEQLTTADRLDALRSKPRDAEAADLAVSLESLIPGRECEAPGGRFYHVPRLAGAFHPVPGDAEDADAPDVSDFPARYRKVFFGARRAVAPDDLHEALRPLAAADPARITYLDIETCGLAGEPVFLVGLMRYGGRLLRVDQLLARDYSEERPMLAAFWRELAGTECLVTFNGKAFDVPFVQARSVASGIFDPPPLPPHVDLLHEARRRWKRDLPNCRLQTLEEMVCGRRRAGDIPGCDIPAAYHDFVRAHQGDDPVRRARSLRRLQVILHHNALDLVTMGELAMHILAGEA